MPRTHESLVRRIDRCYLVAALTRVPFKRVAHLQLARHYRRLLSAMPVPALA